MGRGVAFGFPCAEGGRSHGVPASSKQRTAAVSAALPLSEDGRKVVGPAGPQGQMGRMNS
jgi:hypothetical protein